MSGLKWKVDRDRSGAVVALSGSIDEDARLDVLSSELQNAGSIRMDLSGVIRINSCGVREWVNFMRAVPREANTTLENCPSVVVAQINMISNFTGGARITSVRVPYVCKDCGLEEELPIDTAEGTRPALPTLTCPRCKKKEFVFDDVEDSYFAFLS